MSADLVYFTIGLSAAFTVGAWTGEQVYRWRLRRAIRRTRDRADRVDPAVVERHLREHVAGRPR